MINFPGKNDLICQSELFGMIYLSDWNDLVVKMEWFICQAGIIYWQDEMIWSDLFDKVSNEIVMKWEGNEMTQNPSYLP